MLTSQEKRTTEEILADLKSFAEKNIEDKEILKGINNSISVMKDSNNSTLGICYYFQNYFIKKIEEFDNNQGALVSQIIKLCEGLKLLYECSSNVGNGEEILYKQHIANIESYRNNVRNSSVDFINLFVSQNSEFMLQRENSELEKSYTKQGTALLLYQSAMQIICSKLGENFDKYDKIINKYNKKLTSNVNTEISNVSAVSAESIISEFNKEFNGLNISK